MSGWAETIGAPAELAAWARTGVVWADCPRAGWVMWALGRLEADPRTLRSCAVAVARAYAAGNASHQGAFARMLSAETEEERSDRRERDRRRASEREAALVASILARRWPIGAPRELARCRPAICVAWDRISERPVPDALPTEALLGGLPLLAALLGRVPGAEPQERDALAAIARRCAASSEPEALCAAALDVLGPRRD